MNCQLWPAKYLPFVFIRMTMKFIQRGETVLRFTRFTECFFCFVDRKLCQLCELLKFLHKIAIYIKLYLYEIYSSYS